MTFRKSTSAGYLANHMARLFAKALAQRIRPLGLQPAQFMTLLELWDEDGLTQRQLVDRLDVEQATMANTLTRMERDGWIRRRPHESDGRSHTVQLTDRARDVHGPAIIAARDVNAQALENLTPEEIEGLVAAMARVIAALRQDPLPPGGPDVAAADARG